METTKEVKRTYLSMVEEAIKADASKTGSSKQVFIKFNLNVLLCIVIYLFLKDAMSKKTVTLFLNPTKICIISATYLH